MKNFYRLLRKKLPALLREGELVANVSIVAGEPANRHFESILAGSGGVDRFQGLVVQWVDFAEDHLRVEKADGKIDETVL